METEYEIRKAMLEVLEPKEIRSIIFQKKKEVNEIRVQKHSIPILQYLSKRLGIQFDMVHNSYLGQLREDCNNVITTLENELKRRDNGYSGMELQELKSLVPISVVVQHYIPSYGQHRKGQNIRCPFHEDGTASLHIYDTTNSFKCFGCGAGGSAIDFIMKSDKCSIQQAIKILQTFA